MSWDAIIGIAEVVGTVAVLITLFYLSRQLRQTTEEVRSANYHGVTDSFNQLNLTVAGNVDLARVFKTGNENYDSLSEEEKYQYGFFMHSAFRILDVIKFQSERGTGDTTLWEFENKTLHKLLEAPGGRRWWKERPYNFSEDFVLYVENEVLPKYENDT